MNEKMYIPLSEGAGSVVKGDRIKWCDGLYGVVLGVFMNQVMVETDDGVTRMTSEANVQFPEIGK